MMQQGPQGQGRLGAATATGARASVFPMGARRATPDSGGRGVGHRPPRPDLTPSPDRQEHDKERVR